MATEGAGPSLPRKALGWPCTAPPACWVCRKLVVAESGCWAGSAARLDLGRNQIVRDGEGDRRHFSTCIHRIWCDSPAVAFRSGHVAQGAMITAEK